MVDYSKLNIGQKLKCGEQIVIITALVAGKISAKNIDSDYECVYYADMLELLSEDEISKEAEDKYDAIEIINRSE